MGITANEAMRRDGMSSSAANGPLRDVLLGALLLATSSCGGEDGPTEPDPEPPAGPATGSLAVATSTSGPDADGDGYTVTVDDGAGTEAVGVDDTVVVTGLEEGSHSVALSNIAPNCAAQQGDNPRPATVTRGDTARTTFEVTCAGRSSLLVATSTLAGGLDADGYRVTVDGRPPRSIGSDDTELFAAVGTGEHTVELSGLAAECSSSGPNPRHVTAPVDDTASAIFELTCGPSRPVFFSSFRNGNRDIYVTGAEITGSPMRITDDPANDRSPSVSPDGTRIAFVSLRDGDREIYLTAADGSGDPVRLTDQAGSDGEPAWSPDGSQIAFVSDRGGSSDIWLVSADGSSPPTNLTGTDAGTSNANPAWSPDGSRVAFWRRSVADPDAELFVMAADGSDVPVRLTDNTAEDFSPAWSPDGSRIAFVSDRAGDRDIYVMDAGGSNAVLLTRAPGFEESPGWSSDGSHIVFTTERDGDAEIYRMDADGSDPVNLTEHPAQDFTPAWSP